MFATAAPDATAISSTSAGESRCCPRSLAMATRLGESRRSPPPRAAILRGVSAAADAPPKIIALFGPTGIGKTAIAVALAPLLQQRGEDPVAVSADALQIYAGLETLTGVASAAERATLEHRLRSLFPPDGPLVFC